MEPPNNLTLAEFLEWKEKRLVLTQSRVLVVFAMWLQNHELLQEEPHIAQRLTDFLSSILETGEHSSTAKSILQNLERLVSFISAILF
jgi:son of sevenless